MMLQEKIGHRRQLGDGLGYSVADFHVQFHRIHLAGSQSTFFKQQMIRNTDFADIVILGQ